MRVIRMPAPSNGGQILNIILKLFFSKRLRTNSSAANTRESMLPQAGRAIQRKPPTRSPPYLSADSSCRLELKLKISAGEVSQSAAGTVLRLALHPHRQSPCVAATFRWPRRLAVKLLSLKSPENEKRGSPLKRRRLPPSGEKVILDCRQPQRI